MKSEETIEQRLEKLAKAIAPEEKLVENVMSRIDTKSTTSPSIENIWKTLIKNPTTKLATAAVVIIAVALLTKVLDKLESSAYAITDLPKLFEEARIINVHGWDYFPGRKMANGTKISPQEIDTWIDLENGRLRHRYTAFTGTWIDPENARSQHRHTPFAGNSNSVKIVTWEMISSGKYRLDLNHTDKNATFFRVSDYQRMFIAHNICQLMQLDALGDVEQLENFRKVGWEEIDGIRYDIWLGQVVHSVRGHANRFKFWVRPDTKELVRTQSWIRADSGQWQLQYDYEIFRNLEIPQGIFETQVPQGYTALNQKSQARKLLPPKDFSGSVIGYQIDEHNLLLQTAISFTMSDGSVILAWSSLDRMSTTPLNVLFENLRFGGPLPKLPVEIYRLKPAGIRHKVTYEGYHLAYTGKAERLSRFTEWSLFVPNGNPPWSVKRLGYDVICDFNLKLEPPWTINLNVSHGLTINSAEDFNAWVLGAMEELSDDGKAPDDVSYERVLQLAKRIRESLAQ